MKRLLFVLIGIAFFQQASAQLAPTGYHYAGRPLDTGHGGANVSAVGSYFSEIPLDLPRARGTLPIPLRISYGETGVGAVGLDWHITASYIRQSRTFAHRRPAFGQSVLPSPRERTILSLLGESIELMPKDGMWIARSGNPALIAQKSGNAWLVYDGDGLTYSFVQPSELTSTGMWLLKSISATGSRLDLTYQLNTWPLNGGLGIEVNLIRLAYNTLNNIGCAKNEIALAYGQRAAQPLSIAMVGENPLVRFRTLTRIDVLGRASCADSPVSLRGYEFRYKPDPDTTLPRLADVRMFGRQGTPEEQNPLPIGAYEYGSATSTDGNLAYQITQTILLPAHDDGYRISGTIAEPPSFFSPVPGHRYAMWQSLIDMTADGRPELVFKKNNKLWMNFNHPIPSGKTAFGSPLLGGQAEAPLQDSVFQSGPLSMQAMTRPRFWNFFQPAPDPINAVNVWRQMIDVNGDGRIDIIDASETPKTWVIYLNTPGGPTSVKWERRTFSVEGLGLELASRGHQLEDGFIPLSRKTTGGAWVLACLKRNGANWGPYSGRTTLDGINAIECVNGVPTSWPADRPTCLDADAECPNPERTFTEWELMDLNGDGYPDFVFNSKPVEFAPLEPPSLHPSTWLGQLEKKLILAQSQIRVAYNVVGVRFRTDGDIPFSRSVSVSAPSSSGVGSWMAGSANSDIQFQLDGLTDVNGDGLIDRVAPARVDQSEEYRAYLGAHIGTALAFSSVYVKLPGPMAIQESDRKAKCKPPGTIFTSELIAGLRDLTGDGIPDYYASDKVSVGTGAGFAPSIPLSAVNFVLSHQTESCDGDFSNTDGGVFDIDGDGKPDLIGLAEDSDGNRHYLVHQLVGGSTPRRPEAGRLTSIDNGYGAKTRIAYQSAKEDTRSAHQVPFPEIVITSVDTAGTLNLGGALSGTRHAYGGAEMVFDSAQDRFTFAGYRRSVVMHPHKTVRSEGFATVTDTWPLTDFSPTLTQKERWLRTQRVGRIREAYTLRGSETADPWALLGVDQNDPRVIGVTRHEWDAKAFSEPANSNDNFRDCFEIVNSLDYSASQADIESNAISLCRTHGFLFALSSTSWHGTSPPPASSNNVQTRVRAVSVDNLGRATLLEYEGDLARSDDNFCVEKTFAQPTSQFPRRLYLPASQKITESCDAQRTTLAKQIWRYDGLPEGKASNGWLTSHIVEHHATDNGEPIRQERRFDASYDALGNVKALHTSNAAGVRNTSFFNDPFGLVTLHTKVDATSLPSRETYSDYDQASLNLVNLTEINGTQRSASYDGYGRIRSMTVTSPGGIAGVLSTYDYVGFGGNQQPGERKVVVTEYSDPVAAANLPSARGQATTTFLDELGRVRRSDIALGSDYGNDALVVGMRSYDGLGRLEYEADPFALSQGAERAYGVTYHYKNDGDVDCIIRGKGKQERTSVTALASETLPTCFQRFFANHVDTLDIRDPESLRPSSPVNGTALRIVSSATGLELERSTINQGVRLDHMTLAYDRLGGLKRVRRFMKSATADDAVEWYWRRDSAGLALRQDEPETAARFFAYEDDGGLKEVSWMDGLKKREVVNAYDALGRLTRTRELTAGVEDPEALRAFIYDQADSPAPLLTPIFTLGRLAAARSVSGEVTFSYDGYGNISGKAYRDRQGTVYIEKSHFSAGGRLGALEFQLPDTNYATEIAKYDYDSAFRLRGIGYAGPSGSSELYRALKLDRLGRVRAARLGDAVEYRADYQDSGRNNLTLAEVKSPFGWRRFGNFNYDALGRRVGHVEYSDALPAGRGTAVRYDALGRVTAAIDVVGGAAVSQFLFGYDALGNLSYQADVLGAEDMAATFSSVDRDRLCSVSFAGLPNPSAGCNVLHGASGEIVRQPTRTGSRTLSYFNSGDVRAVLEETPASASPTDPLPARARFAYDAFGDVSELDVDGVDLAGGERKDRRFGSFLEKKSVAVNAGSQEVLFRSIPGPAGLLARRGSADGDWVFSFGESKGLRHFVSTDGTFLQDVSYRPFGAAKSAGAPTGAETYSTHQWNGSDSIEALGLSQLGARIYDPAFGRFLSRDPISVFRGSASANPYAFALNDPFNMSDPSGLDPLGDNLESVRFTGAAGGPASSVVSAAADYLIPSRGWIDGVDASGYWSSSFKGPASFSRNLGRIGRGFDVVEIGANTVVFVRNPSILSGNTLGRSILEAAVASNPYGLAAVFIINGAEIIIGKERIARGVEAAAEGLGICGWECEYAAKRSGEAFWFAYFTYGKYGMLTAERMAEISGVSLERLSGPRGQPSPLSVTPSNPSASPGPTVTQRNRPPNTSTGSGSGGWSLPFPVPLPPIIDNDDERPLP